MRLHSRWGSIVLGVAGSIYVLSSIALLSWTIPTIGRFAGLKDYVVFLAVMGAGVVGGWFVVVAMTSLNRSINLHLPHFRRTHPGRP